MSVAGLVAWLFVTPLELPGGAKLAMFLPLAACIALVYRATRVRRAADVPRGAAVAFFNIVVGMSLIAAGFYALHVIVLRYF